MRKCVVERDRKENRRLLAGIGIPLVGGFLLLLLSRWLHIPSARSDVFAYVVILLLAGAGSFLIARGVAIVMTPLLVLGGFLLSAILQGAYLDLLVEWIQRFSPLFLLVALVGATLGVGMAKLGVRAQRTMGGLIPAPSVPSSSPPEASNPQAGQPEQEEGKQDDIARVLAQMQHDYASGQKQEEQERFEEAARVQHTQQQTSAEQGLTHIPASIRNNQLIQELQRHQRRFQHTIQLQAAVKAGRVQCDAAGQDALNREMENVAHQLQTLLDKQHDNLSHLPAGKHLWHYAPLSQEQLTAMLENITASDVLMGTCQTGAPTQDTRAFTSTQPTKPVVQQERPLPGSGNGSSSPPHTQPERYQEASQPAKAPQEPSDNELAPILAALRQNYSTVQQQKNGIPQKH